MNDTRNGDGVPDQPCCGLRTRAVATSLSVLVLIACGVAVSSLIAREENEYEPERLLPPQPTIVNAETKLVADVLEELGPAELVLGVTVNDQSRAYPINMLTGPSREIINDQLGGRAIAATW